MPTVTQVRSSAKKFLDYANLSPTCTYTNKTSRLDANKRSVAYGFYHSTSPAQLQFVADALQALYPQARVRVMPAKRDYCSYDTYLRISNIVMY